MSGPHQLAVKSAACSGHRSHCVVCSLPPLRTCAAHTMIGILAITQQCGQQLLACIAMAAALDETNTIDEPSIGNEAQHGGL